MALTFVKVNHLVSPIVATPYCLLYLTHDTQHDRWSGHVVLLYVIVVEVTDLSEMGNMVYLFYKW